MRHRSTAIMTVLTAALLVGCTTQTADTSAAPVTPPTATTEQSDAVLNPMPALDLRPGTEVIDVSFPQCEATLGNTLPVPTDPVVIGINEYYPTTRNDCFAEQTAWASGVDAKHPPLLYANAANPAGDPTITTWPAAGDGGKYGECLDTISEACAYVYGQERIVGRHGETDATGQVREEFQGDLAFIGSNDLTGRIVFLVVEQEFSWNGPATLNIAVLEGMSDAIRKHGGQPGIYSTANDWKGLIGKELTPGDNLYGIPIWWRGADNLEEATANCQLQSFTGGKIVLSQVPGERFLDRVSRSRVC